MKCGYTKRRYTKSEDFVLLMFSRDCVP